VEADAGGSLAGLDFHRDLAVLVSRAKLDLSELRVTASMSGSWPSRRQPASPRIFSSAKFPRVRSRRDLRR
jgi:hypothetical protein